MPTFQDADFPRCRLSKKLASDSCIEVSRNPLGLLFFRVRLRRDRNSSASRFRTLLSLPLLRLCSTSGAPDFEVSRAHRFGGSRGREAEGSLPMCSLGTENPPGSGWVWCSYESRRQAVDDDSSTRRSRRSVTSVARLRALLRSSGGMCNGAHLD